MKKDRQDLLNQLANKINQAMKTMHNQCQFIFGEFQIGRQQAIIVFYISESKEAVTVKNLAKFLCVTPGAVTQFVDVLVEKKLVKRVINKKDRRMTIIKLTNLAKKLLSRFQHDYFLTISQTFCNFKIGELNQLLKLISKLSAPNIKSSK